jgi:hypothetical protein
VTVEEISQKTGAEEQFMRKYKSVLVLVRESN